MTTRLVRHDLLHFEERLSKALQHVLPFTGHAVYFPQEDPPIEPVWIGEEGRLLLPLMQDGEVLGVFMARFEEEHALFVKSLVPCLVGIAALCVENLSLYKAGQQDSLTGLATREVLLHRLCLGIQHIRETVLGGEANLTVPEGAPESAQVEDGMGTLGLVVLRCGGLSELSSDVGHGFSEAFLVKLAEALQSIVPDNALAARIGETDLAVLLPDAGKDACFHMAVKAVRAMQAVSMPNPMTLREVHVAPCAGYAVFPQDMDGVRIQDMVDPEPILVHKAQLAAERLGTRLARHERVVGYGDILREGGEITDILHLGRVHINLGRLVGLSEGMRFSIWSTSPSVAESTPEPLYKGELVVLEPREHDAIAEILHLGDPSWLPEEGDTLLYLQDEPSITRAVVTEEDTQPIAQRTDPITGLWRHGEFLSQFSQQRAQHDAFSMSIVQISSLLESKTTSRTTQAMEQAMAQVAELCRETFRNHGLDVTLGGRFALNSLIFFHPSADTNMLEKAAMAVADTINNRFGKGGIGLFRWPFLDFHAADAVECCRKALEYALLLPSPHVGWLDSLAMNISADKLHCKGDVFGAINEYKLALLIDVDNALAWNSLGVCMAGLGRQDEARHYFEEAIQRTPDDPALAYNLGAVCRSLGDEQSAARYFEQCLSLTPDHLFAKIRLGQLARAQGDLDRAQTLFEEAAASHAEHGLAKRHLATLALTKNDTEKAREHLHEALLRNPNDAAALALMAGLYLDNNEDPSLAETLARQSVALSPHAKAGWQQLIRALEKQGRHAEAAKVSFKAKAL